MKKDQTITIRITETTKNHLEKIAQEEDRTLSFVVNRILERYIRESQTK